MIFLAEKDLKKLSMRQQIRVLKAKVLDQNDKIRFLLDENHLWSEGRYTFPDGGTFYELKSGQIN